MSEILSDQPSINDLPDSDESDSRPDASSSSEGATPEPASAKKSDAKPKQEAKAAPTVDDDDESDKVEPQDLDGFKRALAAARRDKRKARKQWQEAERKLAEFEGRQKAIEQMQRQAPIQQAQQPQQDVDPDKEFFELGPGKYFESRSQRERAEAWQRDIADREALLSLTVPDFAEAANAFREAAMANPVLLATFNGQPTAAQAVAYAYRQGKEFSAVKKYGAGTLEELRAKVREEVEAELRGGAGAESEVADEPTPSVPAKPIPRSIASARGSGASVTKAWSGPRPLSEILR